MSFTLQAHDILAEGHEFKFSYPSARQDQANWIFTAIITERSKVGKKKKKKKKKEIFLSMTEETPGSLIGG